MRRSNRSRLVWLMPLIAAVASCSLLPARKPPEPEPPPTPAGPSQADLARQRQLALLLEKIQDLETRLASDTQPDTTDERVAPPTVPVRPTSDGPAVGIGTNTTSRVTPGPVAVAADPPSPPEPLPAAEVTLAALIEEFEARTKADPRDLDLKRKLRVLYLLAGRDEDAVDLITGAPEEEQTFWQQVMWALVNFTDDKHGLSRSERAAAAVRALDGARDALVKLAPLEIRSLAFCSEIRSFGNYTKVPDYVFTPRQLVLLYCELDSFTSEPAADREMQRSVIKQRLELLTPRGDSVWTREFDDAEDLCRGRRRDFYFYSKFTIPDRLLPGEYILKVTMTDILGAKTAEDTLTIRVK